MIFKNAPNIHEFTESLEPEANLPWISSIIFVYFQFASGFRLFMMNVLFFLIPSFVFKLYFISISTLRTCVYSLITPTQL